MVIDAISYGSDQVLQVLEDTAADAVCSQVAEEPGDHVEPGSLCLREAEMESLMFQQPALDARMFVSRVVAADQVDFLLCRDRLGRPGNDSGDPVGLNRRRTPGAQSILHQSGDAKLKKPARPKALPYAAPRQLLQLKPRFGVDPKNETGE